MEITRHFFTREPLTLSAPSFFLHVQNRFVGPKHLHHQPAGPRQQHQKVFPDFRFVQVKKNEKKQDLTWYWGWSKKSIKIGTFFFLRGQNRQVGPKCLHHHRAAGGPVGLSHWFCRGGSIKKFPVRFWFSVRSVLKWTEKNRENVVWCRCFCVLTIFCKIMTGKWKKSLHNSVTSSFITCKIDYM